MGNPEIRKAAASDQEAVLRTLCRAFDADPVVNWLVRQDHRRRAAMEEFFGVCFRILSLPFGENLVTRDLNAAALWVPPGKWKLGFLRQLMMLPRFVRCAGRGRILRSFKSLNNLIKVHPHELHYYLVLLGTDPEHQGKGLGRSLLEPVLRRCDEERVGAYLEATTEKNESYYQRFGFKTTGMINMGKGAPPYWAMWRKPAR